MPEQLMPSSTTAASGLCPCVEPFRAAMAKLTPVVPERLVAMSAANLTIADFAVWRVAKGR
jgi:hypothetical protein